MKNIYSHTLRLAAFSSFSLLALSACSTQKEVVAREKETVYVVQTTEREVPGAVEYVWEEPMVDVIDVPAGLDPEGYYYMPSHQEVVEIRQGRWEYHKKQQ
jgi:hypothetical protein